MDARNVSLNRLSEFEIIEPLGRGASSFVYRARNLLSNKSVAIKVVDASSELRRVKASKEVRFHRTVTHPGFAQLLEDFSDESSCYLVLEFCEKGELFSLLQKKGKLPEKEAMNFLKPLLEALEWLHSKGIAHGDIKLGNIFLTKDLTPKIGDFGLMKRFEVEKESSQLCNQTLLRSASLKQVLCKSPAPKSKSKFNSEIKSPFKSARTSELLSEDGIQNSLNTSIKKTSIFASLKIDSSQKLSGQMSSIFSTSNSSNGSYFPSFVSVVSSSCFQKTNCSSLLKSVRPSILLPASSSLQSKSSFRLTSKAPSGIRESSAKTLRGTPHYISPEIIEQEAYGPAADIWALGCVFFALLHGKLPFEGNSPCEILTNVLKNPPSISSNLSLLSSGPLNAMLEPNPSLRKSAKQILESFFFEKKDPSLSISASRSRLSLNRALANDRFFFMDAPKTRQRFTSVFRNEETRKQLAVVSVKKSEF